MTIFFYHFYCLHFNHLISLLNFLTSLFSCFNSIFYKNKKTNSFLCLSVSLIESFSIFSSFFHSQLKLTFSLFSFPFFYPNEFQYSINMNDEARDNHAQQIERAEIGNLVRSRMESLNLAPNDYDEVSEKRNKLSYVIINPSCDLKLEEGDIM